MNRLASRIGRTLLALLVVGALAFGGWEVFGATTVTSGDCPDPCFNSQECVDCCGTGAICPVPGFGECLCP
jgi:hypothetical protein